MRFDERRAADIRFIQNHASIESTEIGSYNIIDYDYK